MKIILVDEEAHQYMDMRDDLAEYKERIAELSSAIVGYLYQISELESKMGTHCNTPSDEQSTHDYPTDTTREEHTSARWSDSDKLLLNKRIFMTGTYYGDARTIENIHALFPYRTRAAVTAMIYHLGGTVKKDIVNPRIQPKVSK